MLSWIGQKNVVFFPEFDRVKKILSLTCSHCQMCIKIYIFNFKNKKTKITRRQKSKRTKKKREYLGKILRNTMISFANLLCCLLTYPPNFSWLFTCNDRNRSICYTTTTYAWSTHLQEQRSKKIIKSPFCLSFSFLYLYFCSSKFVIIETRAYGIAHDENAISSWKQAPEFYNKSFS